MMTVPTPIVYQPRRACAWCGAISCTCATDLRAAFAWERADLDDLREIPELTDEDRRAALAQHEPYPRD